MIHLNVQEISQRQEVAANMSKKTDKAQIEKGSTLQAIEARMGELPEI